MASSQENKPGGKGLMKSVRSAVLRVLPPDQESPAVASEHTKFVPSSLFAGLDPKRDVIVVNRSGGSQYSVAPRPGIRLELPTDDEREKADRPNILIDEQRTKFFEDAAHVLTYPYVDLFTRMIPWVPERRGIFSGNKERTIRRTDKVVHDEIKMNYGIDVTYALEDGGKQLKRAAIVLGNNLTEERSTPRLIMTFDGGRMTSVGLSFDAKYQQALQILTGDSLLAQYLEGQFIIPRFHYLSSNRSSLRINLGQEMGIDLTTPGDWVTLESTFSWEPRQKLFKRYTVPSEWSKGIKSPVWKITQSHVLQLVRDMLALVPALEKGNLDFARTQRAQQIQAKSLMKLVEEVEKLQLPSGEQFAALIKLMDEDSRQMHLQMGIDPNTRRLESSVDRFSPK